MSIDASMVDIQQCTIQNPGNATIPETARQTTIAMLYEPRNDRMLMTVSLLSATSLDSWLEQCYCRDTVRCIYSVTAIRTLKSA